MNRFPLLLAGALVAGTAHASFYVWVDGQSTDITGGEYYSQYVQDVNTTIFDDKVIHSPDMTNAAFGSSSSMGTLKAYAEADTTGVNLNINPEVWGRGQYTDNLVVGGSGPVTLRFSMPTTGTFAPGSWDALGSASLEAFTSTASLLYLSYRVRMDAGVTTVEQNLTSGEVTVDPGTQIRLAGYLVARARLVRQNPNALMSGVDFSHTSNSFIEVLTPGGTISSESGHNYSPVPEPATLVALTVGAVSLASRRRRFTR